MAKKPKKKSLIEAAPELLAVCKEVLQFLARNTPIVNSDHAVYGRQADAFDAMRTRVREVITKAEGQEKFE